VLSVTDLPNKIIYTLKRKKVFGKISSFLDRKEIIRLLLYLPTNLNSTLKIKINQIVSLKYLPDAILLSMKCEVAFSTSVIFYITTTIHKTLSLSGCIINNAPLNFIHLPKQGL
jgi:hypothetical protein